MGEIEVRAHELAERAHAAIDQRRKYTHEPYITHPVDVAGLVRSVPHTEEMIAAAYLHDTAEDAGLTYEDIFQACGHDVMMLVWWLTDKSAPEDGNRAKRKAIDREYLVRAPADAQTIKVADVIDNTRSIVKHDPGFARVYLQEKRALLGGLTEAEPVLLRYAWEILGASEKNLETEGA